LPAGGSQQRFHVGFQRSNVSLQRLVPSEVAA
jgi:hypothetical protein